MHRAGILYKEARNKVKQGKTDLKHIKEDIRRNERCEYETEAKCQSIPLCRVPKPINRENEVKKEYEDGIRINAKKLFPSRKPNECLKLRRRER
jgi:hypothetical protein